MYLLFSRIDNPEILATFVTYVTRRSQTTNKHNTICVGHHCTQTIISPTLQTMAVKTPLYTNKHPSYPTNNESKDATVHKQTSLLPYKQWR